MADLYAPFFLPIRSRARRAIHPASALDRLGALLELLRPVFDHTSPDPAMLEIIRQKLTPLFVDLYLANYSNADFQRAVLKAIRQVEAQILPVSSMDSSEIDTNENPYIDIFPPRL